MDPNEKRDYFNSLAERWDGLPAPPDAPEKLARFVRMAVPPDAREVLDAGCGTGLLAGHLTAGHPARRVVEVDFAERMLVLNREKMPAGRVLHVCADARRLPFRPLTFDLVLCFNALPHMTPLEEALSGLLACVRPGGSLAVGHLMGSEELNAFHASLGGAVAGDRLPSAASLADVLSHLGAEIVRQEDAAGWYAVECRKRV